MVKPLGEQNCPRLRITVLEILIPEGSVYPQANLVPVCALLGLSSLSTSPCPSAPAFKATWRATEAQCT